MTLERRPGGDADDVRRDLGAAMASADRREGVSTRHDARPPALEAAAIASSTSRSTFPEAFNSVSFINVQADGTATCLHERRAPGEGARRWALLTRLSLPQGGSRAEPRVPRRLYDPELDGAGRVGCEVKGGKGVRARVGNTSSGTCMREEGAKSVCGPKLTDQIVFKRRVKKLGCVLDSL